MAGKLQMNKIATLTGYSVSTVSRVLSGKSCTSEQARDAIVACARQLGVMDELNMGRLLINGLIIFAPTRSFSSHGDIFYHEIIEGIAQTVEPHDVYLSYCGMEEYRSDLKLFIEKASNKNISAIIFIGIDDTNVLKLASTLNKPCVLINYSDQEMSLHFDTISPDHRAISYNTIKYVFEQGHRRVLTVTTLRRSTYYTKLGGIKDAYHNFHVPFDPARDIIVTESTASSEATDAVSEWFDKQPKSVWPEVVFAANVEMAMGIHQMLSQKGIRIPQDVSIITTDSANNIENISKNSVTGMIVPCRELGVEAIHLLQNRLNRPLAPVFNLLLQGRLIDNGTVIHATKHAARINI